MFQLPNFSGRAGDSELPIHHHARRHPSPSAFYAHRVRRKLQNRVSRPTDYTLNRFAMSNMLPGRVLWNGSQ